MQVRDDQGDDDDDDERHQGGDADHGGAPHVGGGEDPACNQEAAPQATQAGEGRRGGGHRHARGQEAPHDHADHPGDDEEEDLNADPPQQVGVLGCGPEAGSLGGHLRSSHNESAVGRIPKSYPTADWRSEGHALSARTCASRSSGRPTGP